MSSSTTSTTTAAPTGADLITAERARQISGEGWTPEHDDTHTDGAMALAAACYAWPGRRPAAVKEAWPWDRSWWKPTLAETALAKCGCRSVGECWHFGTTTEDARRVARVRDLVKAGALIAAEIDRLQRATASADA